MSNKISEQAPQTPQPSGGAIDKVRKQARQLAYDVRYKVKGMFKDGQKTNPSALLQAYMKQLAASSAPGPVKALAKSMLSGGNRESYDFFDIEKNISESRSKVFSNVFSEGKEAFVLRVKDADAGSEYERSYMNYEAASRKARELRAKKGVTVEITKKEPKATYDQKGGKPNDGNLANNREPYDKVTRGDVIAGATGNDEMGGKRKVNKEEVIYETEDSNEKTIDVMPKGKKNTVKVSPVAEQIKAELAAISQKKIDEANAAAVGQAQKALETASKKEKDAALRRAMADAKLAKAQAAMESCDTCEKCGKSPCKCEKKEGEVTPMDPREIPTRINLAKNKLRAMGLKMSYDMEGDLVDEAKVDKLLPDYKRSAARNARYDNPDRSRRAAHRERDEMNKDKKDVRRGKTGGPQFQGKTGAERLAKVKSELDEGKSDRPMGEPFHSMSRGMKQKRGAKRYEGDGKYLKMQHIKRQNKKSADADAYRERQRNERGLSMYPEELSVDQQMKISQEYNRMSPEEKRAANKKAMGGNVKKVAPKKDTRTDAQKMTDATGPRPGSRYRGD